MKKILKLLLDGEVLDSEQMRLILNLNEDEFAMEIKELKDANILLGFRPVLNPDFEDGKFVRAAIELKISPERDGGFDKLAERVSKFEQVESCYLMSGAYDLLLFIRAKSLKEVASFVYERLATISGVQSTATHFFLRAYKEQGYSMPNPEPNPDRPTISA